MNRKSGLSKICFGIQDPRQEITHFSEPVRDGEDSEIAHQPEICNETTPVRNSEYSAKIEQTKAKAALKIVVGFLSTKSGRLFYYSDQAKLMTRINVAN